MMMLRRWILWLSLPTMASAFLSKGSPRHTQPSQKVVLDNHYSDHQITPPEDEDDNSVSDHTRRFVWSSVGPTMTMMMTVPSPALAASSKSRTDGYAIQQSEAAWKAQLSPLQYEVLRQGGTERPGYSVLEAEDRPGIFQCAGCGTPLFDARHKFHSGTGWPSFARALPGVEIEAVNPIMASLSGAELRCATCGGHLGDVFADGFLFIGTEAAQTNQRFCIDGAALVFYPDASGEPPVSGDQEQRTKKQLPSWLEPPTITPQSSL